MPHRSKIKEENLTNYTSCRRNHFLRPFLNTLSHVWIFSSYKSYNLKTDISFKFSFSKNYQIMIINSDENLKQEFEDLDEMRTPSDIFLLWKLFIIRYRLYDIAYIIKLKINKLQIYWLILTNISSVSRVELFQVISNGGNVHSLNCE